ncbi:deleted in azoospermia-like, partial [Pyxicephalus adspersus]|uniref:deleted in azoospermia-like n=1 Tax=Pyxicephalus adspersus TaxID=30357 RepID=UPI003B5AA430
YGFVSFMDNIDVQKIVDMQLKLHGKKLRLGPAIRKQSPCAHRGHAQPRPVVYSTSAQFSTPPPPPHYQNMWNASITDTYVQPTPIYNPVPHYVQQYPYSNSPVMVHQAPMTCQQQGYVQMAPQWPGGDQRNYVYPQ